jgi:hypothetical protein
MIDWINKSPPWRGKGWVKEIASSFLLAMTEDIRKEINDDKLKNQSRQQK